LCISSFAFRIIREQKDLNTFQASVLRFFPQGVHQILEFSPVGRMFGFILAPNTQPVFMPPVLAHDALKPALEASPKPYLALLIAVPQISLSEGAD